MFERTQIHFLGTFSLQSSSSLLKVPIIVADKGNKFIKIFCYREECLCKFGGAGTHVCQSLSLYPTQSISHAVETLFNSHLGDRKRGHCREMVVVEVETTVNVRRVRLKKMAVRL